MDVYPVSPNVGAEIHGVDLSQPLSDNLFGAIRDAFTQWGVIFFRDQDISPEQHIAFAERWSAININRFFTPVDGYPMIAEVRKEPDDKMNIGSKWHTDHSYDQEPALGSILYAKEVPPVGGDTQFASMYAAYDALSDGLKETLEGLKAWHSSRHSFGAEHIKDEHGKDRFKNADLAVQDALHPVIITHPLSGRKALYVNAEFTVRFDGWTAEESAPLLNYLYAHGARPEFACRFRWEKGSIAMWDNRATWHSALNDYYGHRRLMHRITLQGVALD